MGGAASLDERWVREVAGAEGRGGSLPWVKGGRSYVWARRVSMKLHS